MSGAYVEQCEGSYRIAGTRVSLDSIVHPFLRGETAEAIAQSLPLLTLEQVYGAVAFYLANREAVDAYLAERQADYEARRQAARDADPMFYKKMADARRSLEPSRP